MNTIKEKLEYIHFTIQEGLNNNRTVRATYIELEQALEVVRELLDEYNKRIVDESM